MKTTGCTERDMLQVNKKGSARLHSSATRNADGRLDEYWAAAVLVSEMAAGLMYSDSFRPKLEIPVDCSP